MNQTGTIISLNDSAALPLQSLKLTFEPIQEGTGDPSPDNVRPISGRDSVKVTVSNEDESHDYTLILPETIYGGEVDAVSGVGSKEWRYVEFDGTEDWGQYLTQGATRTKTYYLLGSEYHPILTNEEKVLCNKANFLFSCWTKDTPWTISLTPNNNGGIYLTVPIEIGASLNDFKSYLAAQYAAGTPVTVCYKLDTPEPFQVTPQPITSLYPNTTIYNSEGAEMYCQYIQAPDLPEDNPFVNPLSEIGQYYKRLAGYSDSVPLPPRCRETHLIYKLIDSSYTVPFTDAHSRIEKYLWDLINETETMIDEIPLSDAEKFLAMLIGVQVTDYPYLNTERNFWMSRCVETRAANIALIGAGGEL